MKIMGLRIYLPYFWEHTCKLFCTFYKQWKIIKNMEEIKNSLWKVRLIITLMIVLLYYNVKSYDYKALSQMGE